MEVEETQPPDSEDFTMKLPRTSFAFADITHVASTPAAFCARKVPQVVPRDDDFTVALMPGFRRLD